MKLHFQVFIVMGLVLCLCGLVQAKKLFLTADEINTYIVDHTVTITEAPDKKTGKRSTYKAHIDHNGTVRTVRPDNDTGSYSWVSRDRGLFCVRNNMSMRKGVLTCGYFQSDGKGGFELFDVKGAREKDGEIVHIRDKELLLSISELQEGYQLK